MVTGHPFRNPELDPLALTLRDMQGAEPPIPDRKTRPEVLVEMNWIVGVIDLMMRRTEDHPSQRARGGDPHVRTR